MHKDSITGEEVIDYDFLGKKLYPPGKMRQADAGKELAVLFRELDRMYWPSRKQRGDKKTFIARGHAAQKQPCVVKMYYTESKAKHIEFLRNYMPQKNRSEVEDKPELFNGSYDTVPESALLTCPDAEEGSMMRAFKISATGIDIMRLLPYTCIIIKEPPESSIL